jgi:hypothetical protein
MMCRSLQQNMASKGQSGHKSVEVDPSQVRSTALGAFERIHGHT